MDEAILYILAAPLPGTRAPAYLMHAVGGVDCVLAYTDLEHLVECCGEHQPWLGVRIDALMADLRDQRLPGPAVNLPLAPESRWTADGPPWGWPSRGEDGEPGQAAVSFAAGPAAVSLAAEPAAGRPEPGPSEFADWNDGDGAAAAVPAPADAAVAEAETVCVTRREWWR